LAEGLFFEKPGDFPYTILKIWTSGRHHALVRNKNRLLARLMSPTRMDSKGSLTAIAKALGGRPVGNGWQAHCPAHDDRDPSLSIDVRGAKVLVHCHAGCRQAEVLAALSARGLWTWSGLGTRPVRAPEQQHDAKADEASDRQRTESALRIWDVTRPPEGTPVEKYLRTRGITLPVPDSLRFHPNLRHQSGGMHPAMVALVARGTDGEPCGIHRTYLSHDGAGKASITPQKMMLASCRGGAVRLGPATTPLLVGEGIETCLAAMQATGWSTWAALSARGLHSLHLPPDVQEVVVLADGDEAGESAAQTAARRWTRGGRLVRIARPPAGMDFNDLLMGLGEGT
jgi:putative DNA primase/helicase